MCTQLKPDRLFLGALSAAHASMCALLPGPNRARLCACGARSPASVCVPTTRPVLANPRVRHRHRDALPDGLLFVDGRCSVCRSSSHVKQYTTRQLDETCLVASTIATEQTAAHFKPIIAANHATTAELQEEKLQLVGERDLAEESYKELQASSKAEYEAKLKVVKREAAGRLEATASELDQVLADLEKEREDGLSQFEQDSLFDEVQPRYLSMSDYRDLLQRHNSLWDQHLRLLRHLRGAEDSEVESEDEGPESPAKRQCIHELDSESEDEQYRLGKMGPEGDTDDE